MRLVVGVCLVWWFACGFLAWCLDLSLVFRQVGLFVGLVEFVGCVTCGLVCWICGSGFGLLVLWLLRFGFGFADLVWFWFAGSVVVCSWVVCCGWVCVDLVLIWRVVCLCWCMVVFILVVVLVGGLFGLVALTVCVLLWLLIVERCCVTLLCFVVVIVYLLLLCGFVR